MRANWKTETCDVGNDFETSFKRKNSADYPQHSSGLAVGGGRYTGRISLGVVGAEPAP
jgi:hypothetical protein